MGTIPPPDFFPSRESRGSDSYGPEGIEERYKSGQTGSSSGHSSDSSYSYSPPRVPTPRPACGPGLLDPTTVSARRGWPLPGVDARQFATACLPGVTDAQASDAELAAARDELVGPLSDVIADMAGEAAALQYPPYPLQANVNLEQAYQRTRGLLSDRSQRALERDGLTRHGTTMVPTFEFLFSAEFLARTQSRIAARLPADLALVTYNVGGIPVASVFVDIRPR